VAIGSKEYLFPQFNVFFYPYPFVGEEIIYNSSSREKEVRVFVLTRDVEVLMAVAPSENSRGNRFGSDYLISCDKAQHPRPLQGKSYDPCFNQQFLEKYPEISGMLGLAKKDADLHIVDVMERRFFSKYRALFSDITYKSVGNVKPSGIGYNDDEFEWIERSIGVPEIVLHPRANRLDNGSPHNYRLLTTLPVSERFEYGYLWDFMERGLSPVGNGEGHITVDLVTKMYVLYEACDPAIQMRSVALEEPYKLPYLGLDVLRGGQARGRMHKRNQTRKRRLQRRRGTHRRRHCKSI
jgi:hypothetical protein